MQAIRVTFHGPTNSRGARYKATCAAGSLTQEYEYQGDDNARRQVAMALVRKLAWDNHGTGQWASGGLKDGSEVFVCIMKGNENVFTVGESDNG